MKKISRYEQTLLLVLSAMTAALLSVQLYLDHKSHVSLRLTPQVAAKAPESAP